MDLEDIMLSGISRIQKAKSGMNLSTSRILIVKLIEIQDRLFLGAGGMGEMLVKVCKVSVIQHE